MKFGIALSTFQPKFGRIVFKGNNIEENLKIIKELGYDGVDLFIHHMNEKEIENLKKLLDVLKLEVPLLVAIFLAEEGINFSDSNEKNRLESIEKFKKQVIVAGIFGSKMPVGFIRGNKEEDEAESVYQKRLASSLKELSEFADSKGVKLTLEPINRYEANTLLRVDQALDFIDKYNLDKIELLIDTFHMNIEEFSIEGAIKMAGSKIGHVHITDSNGRAPGDGHLDYKSIIKTLKEVGYDGYLTSESIPIPSPYENGRRGIENLKKFLSATRL